MKFLSVSQFKNDIQPNMNLERHELDLMPEYRSRFVLLLKISFTFLYLSKSNQVHSEIYAYCICIIHNSMTVQFYLYFLK